MRLVAQQAGTHIGVQLGDGFGREVHDDGLDARGAPDGGIDLVPRQDLVAGDVKGLAKGAGVAKEAHESDGKVAVVCHHPKGGAVAMADDRLALAHAVHHRIVLSTDGRGNPRGAIGVRGAHDGDGKALLAVCLHQAILAGDLVARVLPVGVDEGRRFGDDIMVRRLLVGAGGADVHVLANAPGKGGDILLDLIRRVAHKVGHHVIGAGLGHLAEASKIVAVADDGAHPAVECHGPSAAVEHGDVIAPCEGQLDARRADVAAAAHEQDLHPNLLCAARNGLARGLATRGRGEGAPGEAPALFR